MNNQGTNQMPPQNGNSNPQTNSNNNQPSGLANQNQNNNGIGEPINNANPGSNNGPSVMVNSIPQAQQVQEEPQVFDEVPQNPSEILENMEPQAV